MTKKSLGVQIVEAIKNEDCESIRILFADHPAQKESYTVVGGQTWLGYTAQLGKFNIVKELIDIGIDVNLGDKLDGARPICSAACNKHYEITKYLLERGAVLDVSTSIRNPLFSAILGGSPRIVKLLLEAGIDSKVRYNSKTMKNMDAVAFALMRGEKECARIISLWNAGGDEVNAQKALEEADQIAEENAR